MVKVLEKGSGIRGCELKRARVVLRKSLDEFTDSFLDMRVPRSDVPTKKISLKKIADAVLPKEAGVLELSESALQLVAFFTREIRKWFLSATCESRRRQ